MAVAFSEFARTVTVETAFTVLSRARELKVTGKDVIELEIGDSPFPSTSAAKAAGIAAITNDQTHYGPSAGLPEVRSTIAEFMNETYGTDVAAANVVIGPGAKIFELLFCETYLDPGDGVLVFSPYFPTYLPNIARRGGRVWSSDLRQENAFRPNLADVERFLNEDPNPKAIFLNTPHNPTGGVATREDLEGLAELVRSRRVAVFSDEPYDQMVWDGKHHTPLVQPGMLEYCVAAYTFSKSYSMSGWRLGYAISNVETIDLLGKLINTSLSCVPPMVQLAGAAALKNDAAERDQAMQKFAGKVKLLAEGLDQIVDVRCLTPSGTFYVFPNVAPICNRLKMTSHGLAMYLLEAADEKLGVACLGGECFGDAGQGFLRFSCAEPDERLREALDFLPGAFANEDRAQRYLEEHPGYRLNSPYPVPSA